MNIDFYTPARPLKKKRGRTEPTPSIANCFNYFLKIFLPMILRPTKPTPIRINVAGSLTIDVITFSAEAVSGESKKAHNSTAANARFSFISNIPLFLYHAKIMQKSGIVVISIISFNYR